VSDEQARERERRWVASGSEDDEAALLAERVRLGELELRSLQLAAACVWPAARRALAELGEEVEPTLLEPEALAELWWFPECGPAAWGRVVLALLGTVEEELLQISDAWEPCGYCHEEEDRPDMEAFWVGLRQVVQAGEAPSGANFQIEASEISHGLSEGGRLYPASRALYNGCRLLDECVDNLGREPWAWELDPGDAYELLLGRLRRGGTSEAELEAGLRRVGAWALGYGDFLDSAGAALRDRV